MTLGADEYRKEFSKLADRWAAGTFALPFGNLFGCENEHIRKFFAGTAR